ncbi:hypothetical protein ACFSBZ_07065 [Amnibacterium flavum]|uniref:Asparagine synthase n=1 Tax=Amnibacterium flavum TaxID=2173173 RepID=A0A2V1HMG9_9MICO|nr:hypothetical protein [Amnibacterium flavum]PVZ93806.1 hypothetical protein DDQ50_08435 [Amnibacterium flavum]
MRVRGRRSDSAADLAIITPAEEPSVERQVEEGVLIVAASLRLSMKNRLIVRALRDGELYDDTWMTGALRGEIDDLIAEKTSDADRLENTRARAQSRRGRPGDPADYRRMDVHALAMREQITRVLTMRMAELADDRTFTDAIIAAAREAALDEMLGSRLKPSFDPADDPTYARERRLRINALKEDIWTAYVDRDWSTRTSFFVP